MDGLIRRPCVPCRVPVTLIEAIQRLKIQRKGRAGSHDRIQGGSEPQPVQTHTARIRCLLLFKRPLDRRTRHDHACGLLLNHGVPLQLLSPYYQGGQLPRRTPRALRVPPRRAARMHHVQRMSSDHRGPNTGEHWPKRSTCHQGRSEHECILVTCHGYGRHRTQHRRTSHA